MSVSVPSSVTRNALSVSFASDIKCAETTVKIWHAMRSRSTS